jgi:hypothetical protein
MCSPPLLSSSSSALLLLCSYYSAPLPLLLLCSPAGWAACRTRLPGPAGRWPAYLGRLAGGSACRWPAYPGPPRWPPTWTRLPGPPRWPGGPPAYPVRRPVAPATWWPACRWVRRPVAPATRSAGLPGGEDSGEDSGEPRATTGGEGGMLRHPERT